MLARSTLVPIALTIALATGCASLPGGPDFDLRRARIVASASEDPVVPPGAPGKAAAAGAGVAAGLGAGLLFGVLPCVAAGPFAYACISALAPAIAVTTVGTAALATAGADTAENLGAKRDLLRGTLTARETQARLATELTSATGVALFPQAATTAPTPDAPRVARDGQHRWEIRVAVKSVDAAEPGIDVPFALGVVAVMEVHDLSSPAVSDPKGYLRPADAALAREKGIEATKPERGKVYQLRSDERRTLAQWAAEDGAPVRAALDATLTRLAKLMANDLVKRAPDASKTAPATPRDIIDPTGARSWSYTGVAPGARQ